MFPSIFSATLTPSSIIIENYEAIHSTLVWLNSFLTISFPLLHGLRCCRNGGAQLTSKILSVSHSWVQFFKRKYEAACLPRSNFWSSLFCFYVGLGTRFLWWDGTRRTNVPKSWSYYLNQRLVQKDLGASIVCNWDFSIFLRAFYRHFTSKKASLRLKLIWFSKSLQIRYPFLSLPSSWIERSNLFNDPDHY